MGFVVAARTGEGRTVTWIRQIYVVRFNPELEQDVQNCFITGLSLKDHKLMIRNEAAFEYTLDLDSLEVTTINGALVIDRLKAHQPS